MSERSNVYKIIRGLLKTRMEVAPVTIPEDGSDCGVRLLSDSEIAECNVDAFAMISRECKAKDVDVGRYLEANPDGFNRAQIHHIVARSFRDAKDHEKALFEGVDQIRSLDASMVNSLYNTYLDHQDRKAPAKTIDEEEIPNFVAAMVDNAELDYALAQMDAGTLVRMTRYMLRLSRSASTKDTD